MRFTVLFRARKNFCITPYFQYILFHCSCKHLVECKYLHSDTLVLHTAKYYILSSSPPHIRANAVAHIWLTTNTVNTLSQRTVRIADFYQITDESSCPGEIHCIVISTWTSLISEQRTGKTPQSDPAP